MYVDDHVTSTSYLVVTLNTPHNNKIRYDHIMLMIHYSIITACKHLWWYHGLAIKFSRILQYTKMLHGPQDFAITCIAFVPLRLTDTLRHIALAGINQQSLTVHWGSPSPSHIYPTRRDIPEIRKKITKPNSDWKLRYPGQSPLIWNLDRVFMRIQVRICF